MILTQEKEAVYAAPLIVLPSRSKSRLEALFFKTQSHVTLGAGQDMNSSLAKSIQLKGYFK